jgi:hypothetical protein
MLAGLRALREWLLRRNRRTRTALGRVSQGVRGGSWSEFCTKVAALRPGRLWRYAQAGDLPGYEAQIDGELLHKLITANTGKRVIAFTHKPVLGSDPVAAENRRLITAAIKAGFTVNLSADNPAHADVLAELGIAPVVTVLVRAYARRAVRQETAGPVGRNDCRMAGPDSPAAAVHTSRNADRDLPRDLHGRYLQELRRLRPTTGCRDRLPGSRCLASG